MNPQILIREYHSKDVQELANIYFNTIHRINIKHYTEAQINAWAPKSSLEVEEWTKKFARIQPLVAVVKEKIVGFAGLEPNGHIDCFYCHHEWIGKGVGSALMQEIIARAKANQIEALFAEVSMTAKRFFKKHGFTVLAKQNNCKGAKLDNYKMRKVIEK